MVSKVLNTVSFIVISSILAGSVLSTNSWAMEEEKLENTSSISKTLVQGEFSPSDVTQTRSIFKSIMGGVPFTKESLVSFLENQPWQII